MYTNASCNRLIDYYFVVSCDNNGILHIKQKLQNKSLSQSENETSAHHAPFALKPKIIDRFPSINHIDTPLLPWIAQTSMPRGIRARTLPPSPQFYTFIGWNIDTSKLYGACLMVFEKIKIANQIQTVYIPKTLGFVSHYPYFYAFDVFLRCLWYIIPKKLIPLENLLIHYFYDIPPPAPARKIAYDLGDMKVILACRNQFDVPILEIPVEIAFTQLSKDRICFILKLLLLEQRLIFICGDIHSLTPICELFVSLLFPLRWKHLYMPLLNRNTFQSLMSKYNTINLNQNHNKIPPFIIGLPRFVYLSQDIQNNMPINSFLVFVDRNEITDYKKNTIYPNVHMKSGIIIPNLPNILENELCNAIHTLARILTMNIEFDNDTQNNNQNNIQNVHMNISREYTVQAFRTMFSVISKLIYFSTNDTNNKYRNFPFIVKFRKTQLFKSFCRYYKRINDENDKEFNDNTMNKFYKSNEGHGKHFARKINNGFENDTIFNIKLYDKQICRISKDKINKLEMNKIYVQRSKKIIYPIKEFAMTFEAEHFLKKCIWFEKKSKTGRNILTIPTNTNILSYKSRKHKPKKYLNLNEIRYKSSKSYKEDMNNNTKCCFRITDRCNYFTNVFNNRNLRPILHVKGNESKVHSKRDRICSDSILIQIVNEEKRQLKYAGKHNKPFCNKSISLNMTDIALQARIEKFAKDLINNKNDMEKSLNLCVAIERKIQRNIIKYEKETNHWENILYEIFSENTTEKTKFISTIDKLCVQYAEYKNELKLLQNIAHMLVTNPTLVKLTLAGHESDSSDYETDTNNETDSDETDNEESEDSIMSSSSSSSSSWPMDSNDNINDEIAMDYCPERKGQFTKLDEFNVDKKQDQWFDKCQTFHNNELGIDGIKYVNNLINNKSVIGVDFINDYVIHIWSQEK